MPPPGFEPEACGTKYQSASHLAIRPPWGCLDRLSRRHNLKCYGQQQHHNTVLNNHIASLANDTRYGKRDGLTNTDEQIGSLILSSTAQSTLFICERPTMVMFGSPQLLRLSSTVRLIAGHRLKTSHQTTPT
ncbi:hypothetical protein CDAR_580851 [Caerostris darwini]|uniref:Uncharacterized protein n=1 Tax=Caerostris darwini TaxID=1538125 RepID=A0AAV4S6E7_9ARAC|nr:hypothetical protein CDAR_580851 [Caerostris darwini]